MSSSRYKRYLLLLFVLIAGFGMVAFIFSFGAGPAEARVVDSGVNAQPEMTGEAAPRLVGGTGITETGIACVNDYQPGSVCTANDVRIVGIEATNVISPCSGEGTTAITEFVFDIRAQASGSSPNRYDIGIFVDLDGVTKTVSGKLQGGAQLSGAPTNNADGVNRTNGCYHTFLGTNITSTPVYSIPPNDRSLGEGGVVNFSDGVLDLYDGPWWNGQTESPPEDQADTCGDIESGTQLFKTIDVIEFVCSDGDGDGRVDLNVCTSWDNQTGSTCTAVGNAFPNTKSKCSCNFVNFPFDPTGITLGEITAGTTNRWLLPIIGAIVALALVSIIALRRRVLVGQDFQI